MNRTANPIKVWVSGTLQIGWDKRSTLDTSPVIHTLYFLWSFDIWDQTGFPQFIDFWKLMNAFHVQYRLFHQKTTLNVYLCFSLSLQIHITSPFGLNNSFYVLIQCGHRHIKALTSVARAVYITQYQYHSPNRFIPKFIISRSLYSFHIWL